MVLFSSMWLPSLVSSYHDDGAKKKKKKSAQKGGKSVSFGKAEFVVRTGIDARLKVDCVERCWCSRGT